MGRGVVLEDSVPENLHPIGSLKGLCYSYGTDAAYQESQVVERNLVDVCTR